MRINIYEILFWIFFMITVVVVKFLNGEGFVITAYYVPYIR